jgi:hypothetical protein
MDLFLSLFGGKRFGGFHFEINAFQSERELKEIVCTIKILNDTAYNLSNVVGGFSVLRNHRCTQGGGGAGG